MKRYFISKAYKGQEYLYKRQYTITCGSKKRAQKIADFLNAHNSTACGIWKLNDNEVWFVYEQSYEEPLYKIKNIRGNITIVAND